jgi:biofilm protein TabA
MVTKSSGFILSRKRANFPAPGAASIRAHRKSLIMITSTLSQLHWYTAISLNFEKAIQYALSMDFDGLEPGKYSIDGDNIFAIVNEYMTRPLAECDPESHRDYADIQIMINGVERFGYAPLTGQPETTPYNEEKDVAFYTFDPADLNYLTLHPGEFIIFFPSDIHQPEIYTHQPGLVRKVVIKVAL